MTETVLLLSAAETAFTLRLTLGRRQWRDWLADCIRDRTPGLAGGLKLLPYATSRITGSVDRPLYRACDLRAFIQQARELDPTLRPEPVRATPYELDTTIGLPWAVRRASRSSPAGRSMM